MITYGLISLFLSLPFFKDMTFSSEMLEIVKSISSFVYQCNSFLNLDLLVDVVIFCFGVHLVVALAEFIRNII